MCNLKKRPPHTMSNSNVESLPDAPDGGWGWMVVVGGFIVNGCAAGTFRSLGVLFLAFRQQFDASSAETAWVTSIMMCVMYLLAPFATALASTTGFRPVIMLGGVLSATGYVISAFGTRVYHLYLAIGCLTGLGCALTVSPMMVTVGQYFSTRRAVANSLAVLGASIMSMTLPLLFQYLLDEYGLKGALLILGGVMLQEVVAGALVRPLKRHRNESDSGLEMSPNDTSDNLLGSNTATETKSAAVVSLIVPPMYIVPRARDLQIEDYRAASLLTASSIADVVGRLSVGAIPDTPHFTRLDQFGLSLCLLGLTNLLCPLAITYPGLIVYAIAHGLFYGAFVPTSFTCLAELVGPKRLPGALGLYMLVQGFASLTGPPFAGWLYDRTGSYEVAFLQAGVCFLLAGLLPFILRFTKRKTEEGADELEDDVDSVKSDRETATFLLITHETSL
ncbi:PREDICTED: monocarboxylate transporter 13-like isoform X3 [Branchiostoma belcheri]|uniref:Monocarboxylate transporter 13-like isoform X3 n=1 Tax=Branchiostoma belcheri TaxID=7741 RepID=A0A6P4ZLL8_BRABE|nr:PREDICTED: monocarboxylate transporter 13-like isoform X3 [Branchiostoma belcheri]